MEKLGHKLVGALKILKDYFSHKCSHKLNPVTGSDCLLSMLGNQNEKHYFIATQDRDLQNKTRLMPGVPLLYLHGRTPVLEEPSEVSHKFAQDKMSGLFESEKKALEELKAKSGLVTNDDIPKKKKKKKGPNPLSCKKKKKNTELENNVKNKVEDGGIEKKRKKIRIPEHVRKELLRTKSSL